MLDFLERFKDIGVVLVRKDLEEVRGVANDPQWVSYLVGDTARQFAKCCQSFFADQFVVSLAEFSRSFFHAFLQLIVNAFLFCHVTFCRRNRNGTSSDSEEPLPLAKRRSSCRPW